MPFFGMILLGICVQVQNCDFVQIVEATLLFLRANGAAKSVALTNVANAKAGVDPSLSQASAPHVRRFHGHNTLLLSQSSSRQIRSLRDSPYTTGDDHSRQLA